MLLQKMLYISEITKKILPRKATQKGENFTDIKARKIYTFE